MDTMITSHDDATDNAGMRPVRFIGSAAATRPHRLSADPLVSKRIRNNAQPSRVPRRLLSVISKIGHGHTRVSARVVAVRLAADAQ